MPSSDAWAPYQRVKLYDIPDKIFEQYNQAQVSTSMGLFAELNHAWIAIDNALYIWDYTDPNPELIGFEDQPNSITAVKLLRPRPGVFVAQITHLLVVATTQDIILIGLSCQTGPGGNKQVSLYQTRMQVSVKGLDVSCIEGSAATGRIFFSGHSSNDIYELTYSQEEKWFSSRCGKINHSQSGYSALLPQLPFSQKGPLEHVRQLVVDDTRNLLYTLSSQSNISVFHVQAGNGLVRQMSTRSSDIKMNITHIVPQQSRVLGKGLELVSLDVISSREATRLTLMATTKTGHRLYFSATSGSFYSNPNAVPTSMQLQHIRYPPPGFDPIVVEESHVRQTGQQPPQLVYAKTLWPTTRGTRFPGGYFLCFTAEQQTPNDNMLMAVPDSGRIAKLSATQQTSRLIEFADWKGLQGKMQDVGAVTMPWANQAKAGFGNELALQFDAQAPEFAILTNTGVSTFRRRRLVDIFASVVRHGGGDQGLRGEVDRFVKMYGRGETAATALAVACGHGSDVSADSRVVKVTDPDVVEYARTAFIEYGGKAMLNENSVNDPNSAGVDNVIPSPRHQGIALYIARIVRSLWNSPIIRQFQTPVGGMQVSPVVPLEKLRDIQQNMTRLQEFLDGNRSFIDGLSGPESLGRAATKQDELALQGEHRAMYSLVQLISDVIEGISFVLVLFDEQVTEIMLSLPQQSRENASRMAFQDLFCRPEGKELAKELVKAIVNRNIANGSNVETVAEALRRRCGSFCSAEDVVVFKAQELLKRASEAGADSDNGRRLLNDALKLFQKVSAGLPYDVLGSAVEQFISMSFYAGAIQLCLSVAQESDRGNRALSWMRDGSPEQDPRKALFESRQRCYDLIHKIIQAVDQATSSAPEMADGYYTTPAKRRREAYDVINASEDDVFQTTLYDWYLSQGWSDRLLEIQSPHVVAYLESKSSTDLRHADLLWRYHVQQNNYTLSASVQLQLAKSKFDLTLEQRLEYLSRAKAHAAARGISLAGSDMSRQSRQELLREISDLLEIASIQEDILQRMKKEPRLSAQRKPEVLRQLDGPILPINELYNQYADQASYHDICLLIYQAADHRNPEDIRATWQNLLESTHAETLQVGQIQPYEAVAEKVRVLGHRLNLSDSTFNIGQWIWILTKTRH